jgi:serine/threonine protein kinase
MSDGICPELLSPTEEEKDSKPSIRETVAQLRKELALASRCGRIRNANETVLPDVTEYVVERTLRHGSFGSVYLCNVVSTPNKKVVAKVMENAPANDDTMFLVAMEIYCAKRVKHFACVDFIEAFEIEHGVVVMVIEYVDKCSLGRHLRYAYNAQRYYSQEEVEGYICPLLLGLHHIHSQNLVHRDIKPRNIVIGSNGIPKLIDFGCGKVIKDTLVKDWVGETVIGTAEIFAPERCFGKGYYYGPPADVWSLGVVFYKLIELCSPLDFSCVDRVDEEMKSSDSDVGNGPPREVIDHDPKSPLASPVITVILHHPVQPMTRNDEVSIELKQMVLSMLEKTPYHRPTTTQLLRMKFVRAMMTRYQQNILGQEALIPNAEERRRIMQSIQESLDSTSEPDLPRLYPVAFSGTVMLMTHRGNKYYTLSIVPPSDTNETSTGFSLRPLAHHDANERDEGEDEPEYGASLNECCVTLAAANFFVLRTPTENLSIATNDTLQWVNFLNGYSGDVYHHHTVATNTFITPS